jgi:hypothetical protein
MEILRTGHGPVRTTVIVRFVGRLGCVAGC